MANVHVILVANQLNINVIITLTYHSACSQVFVDGRHAFRMVGERVETGGAKVFAVLMERCIMSTLPRKRSTAINSLSIGRRSDTA